LHIGGNRTRVFELKMFETRPLYIYVFDPSRSRCILGSDVVFCKNIHEYVF
jgi:hypothetical protein